jgi:hypothetical protein
MQKHGAPAAIRHVVPAVFLISLGTCLVASVWSSLAGSVGAVLAVAYAAGNVAASIHTAARSEWRLLPIIPAVFACYHFGYGYGFLRGTCDFLLLRRRPRAAFSTLTRTSAGGSRSSPPLA